MFMTCWSSFIKEMLIVVFSLPFQLSLDSNHNNGMFTYSPMVDAYLAVKVPVHNLIKKHDFPT